MDITLSVVIPSRGNISNLGRILKSIDNQSYKPKKVILLIDKDLSKDDFDVLSYFLLKNISEELKQNINIISNINSEFQPNKGVSYVRNFGINLVTSKYLYIIDDDNCFEDNFFEKSFENRLDIKDIFSKDFLISPTIIYRKTGLIQSQGMKGFNFWLSKVILNNIGKRNFSGVKMIGGNSLFGPTQIFQDIKFDERFEFVYEDLDFSYRVAKKYGIYVIKNLQINHMEREKNQLEKIFIGDEKGAFQKSKNRILFVTKNGTLNEKIKFFGFGLWIQTLWFFVKIYLYGTDKNRLYKAIIKGIIEGLKN